MSNIGENLSNERIADYYTSLLHVSGADLTSFPSNTVYDGAGNVTGLSLSSAGDRVVINNYIMPEGCGFGSGCVTLAMGRTAHPRVKDWLNTFYPIGTIMLTTTPNNPMDKIFGTRWVLESSQRFTVGVGSYTDKNNDFFTFSAGGRGTLYNRGKANGDLAGDFQSRLSMANLPEHEHITDTGLTLNIPSRDERRAAGIRIHGTPAWFPYFGPPINPTGNTQNNSNYREFQGQGAIIGFQNDRSDAGPGIPRANHFTVWNKQFSADQAFEEGDAVAAQDRGVEVRKDAFVFAGRAAYIRKLYDAGYRYTDADFNPTLGNRSLRGWAGPVQDKTSSPGWDPVARLPFEQTGGVDASGGPGWGGYLYLQTNRTRGGQSGVAQYAVNAEGEAIVPDPATRPEMKNIFIGNSPRPIGEIWQRNRLPGTAVSLTDPPSEGEVLRENVKIVGGYGIDPRDSAYIHPGELSNDQIIRAFRIVREALQVGDTSVASAVLRAQRMFRGVTRLQELSEPAGASDTTGLVENVGGGPVHELGTGTAPSFTTVQVPGYNSINSTSAGDYHLHNNIPPNYGVYVWRRVREDFVEEVVVCPDPDLYGCNEPAATNFNPNVTINIPAPQVVDGVLEVAKPGCCIYPPDVVPGCMEVGNPNYNPDATVDDGSCDLPTGPSIWKMTITRHHKELDLCKWARGKGWNGRDEAEITLASGKYLWADGSGNKKKPALEIRCFNKLTFINRGYIIGRGGNGGSKAGSSGRSAKGQHGGDGVHVHGGHIIFQNHGYIAGGGGGGGGSTTGSQSGGGGGAGGGWGGTSGRHAYAAYVCGDYDTRSKGQGKAGGRSGSGDGWSIGGGKYHTAGGGAGGGLGSNGGRGLYFWGCGAEGNNKTSGGNFARNAGAGGSGAGGASRSGGPTAYEDPCGTGGGGGRKIPGQGGAANGISRGGCGGDDPGGNKGGVGGTNNGAGGNGNTRAGGGGGGWGEKGGHGSKNKGGSGVGGNGGYGIRKKGGSVSVTTGRGHIWGGIGNSRITASKDG